MRGISLGQATATAETEKALLVDVESLGDEVWVPKSQLHDDSEVYRDGDEGELVVSEWWAEQKGFV